MKFKVKYLKYIIKPVEIINIIFERNYGVRLKIFLINALFQRIFRINSEAKFQVNYTSTIVNATEIYIGKNVCRSFALSGGCYIQAGNGIYINDDTIFAPGVKIISANHNPKEKMCWMNAPPIRIGKRCWIGTNAVILPGVVIGDDCVIGAGTIVTSSFPSRSVIVGNPGKKIKSL
jgi:acetyltransferase-like isoleucine patch superfamily enzyme